MSNEKDNQNKKDGNKENQSQGNKGNQGNQGDKNSEKSDKRQGSSSRVQPAFQASGDKDNQNQTGQGDKIDQGGRKNEQEDDDIQTQTEQFPTKEKQFDVPRAEPGKYEQKYKDQNAII